MSTILCVDDETDYRESIAEFLSTEGYKVVEADNGENGLQTILDQQPDLIISDVSMPGISGFQMFSELKANHPHQAKAPFIFLTALGQKHDIITGRTLGAEDYIVKPVDFDVLLATIKQRLSYAHQREELHHYNASENSETRILSLLANSIHSHLNSIIGFSDLIKTEALGPIGNDKYQGFMQNILRSSFDILALLNNTIDTAYISQGTLTLPKQHFDIESTVWECTNTLQIAWSEQNVNIRQCIESPLPILEGDEEAITRAICAIGHDIIQHTKNKNALNIQTLQLDEQHVALLVGEHMINTEEFKKSPEGITPYSPEHMEEDSHLNGYEATPGILNALFSQTVMEQQGGFFGIYKTEKTSAHAVFVFQTTPQQ